MTWHSNVPQRVRCNAGIIGGFSQPKVNENKTTQFLKLNRGDANEYCIRIHSSALNQLNFKFSELNKLFNALVNFFLSDFKQTIGTKFFAGE
jgi:hypothetical protein